MMSGNSQARSANTPISAGNVIGGGTQFLTVAEVANLMRVSKMTVYRLVHSGELPAVRVGRSFRVHAKAVHDYLETSYFDAG
ncbi:helix-turn-helix domain-containing protein [Nocardia inohanensis]|uniref:helix-turn-helix domain-containing protein n=1 Tax=Nocardia inohanensis TaxID=209246 RepID=UPI000A03842E|nr:helix-turn-helix domain-containing protein [Nocardia inohanensis]